MSEALRVANCSGFFGDRLSAAREMVEGGPIDVLTGDWLAELTMLILARTRAKHPDVGYARTFLTQMEEVLGTCLERGIKVVSNAGGLDPERCAEALAQIAARLGLKPSIAAVSGDDLLERAEELSGADLRHFETGAPLGDLSHFVTANAYLGGFGIAEALAMGADVVITGRVTDAALVCGPATWHHGWGRDDLDQLAGAVVAGHVIECGAQASGGNYSFFSEVAGMARVGFPWVDVFEDGSSVVGKHDATGGEVSIGTITSQLLYEITGPAYLGPDVTARFDTITLTELERDRVRISGVRGQAPPSTLKVALNELAGYRKDLRVVLTGLDIEAKAELVGEAFWRNCPYAPEEFASVTTSVTRTGHRDPTTNDAAEATWHLTLKDPDEAKVGRVVTDALTEIALASAPGFFIPREATTPATQYGLYRPATIERSLVPQRVRVLGGATSVVDSLAPLGEALADLDEPSGPAPGGPTTEVPLGRLFGARSGDKGGDANVGIFARRDDAFAWLDAFLDLETFRRLLPETAPLVVERFRFPRLRALNFVVHGLLDEGVAATTRHDAQAKGLGEWLRARVVAVPVSLLDRAAP